MNKLDREKLAIVLTELEKRRPLIAFREQARIRFVLLSGDLLRKYLASLTQRAEVLPIYQNVDPDLYETLGNYSWEDLVRNRERALMTNRADRWPFPKSFTELTGVNEFILIPEGYEPPQCGVILFFEDGVTGLEATLDANGRLHFFSGLDLPSKILHLLRTTIIFQYRDLIVRNSANTKSKDREIEAYIDSEEIIESSSDEIAQKVDDVIDEVLPRQTRRAHTRQLPRGCKASVQAILRAWNDPKFRTLQPGGPQTYVREISAEGEVTPHQKSITGEHTRFLFDLLEPITRGKMQI